MQSSAAQVITPAQPRAAPAEFFRGAREVYQQAERAAGLRSFTYEIGGEVVRLCFAGPALVPSLTRAFAHLQTGHVREPALTVYLWDSESTHTLMVPPPWSHDDIRAHGMVRGFFDGGLYTLFQWGSHALNMLDIASGEALFWLHSASQLAYFECASPLRSVLHLWLRSRGLQFVHAAAVGFPSGGVLLVGKAGSGKSNATLACLASALMLLADDYSLLRPSGDGPPTVYSLYNTAKTFAESQARLPFLSAMVSNPSRPEAEKALYYLHEHFPEKMLAQFSLRAILVPRITGHADSALRPASQALALAALAPSTILQLPGASTDALQLLAREVRRVPCYGLELGTDLRQVPRLLSGLLCASDGEGRL